tara:strand:+ start:2082 stop:2267 length:186 start_codon:yes stop_codon:yes gene_type:complete
MTMNEDSLSLLTMAEVAGILRLKPRTVSKLKGLAPIRINSRVLRYRSNDVELWLEKKRLTS